MTVSFKLDRQEFIITVEGLIMFVIGIITLIIITSLIFLPNLINLIIRK